ncbi:sulfatase [Parabacteroides sp. OttesenSCG-928-G06]|nr:sulfatase [Parabacteroides sp. OttesenSCG-928-K15]MDL2282153.1 sulfatase [Parabacteroides sp. OttesenSCG-928-G06]
MKTIIPGSIAAGTLLLAIPATAETTEKPVNFIVIYLDDMGYGDLSITGATGYRTPNLDRMAKEGMFFTHYYSPQAVSSASRAGLMTGCYPNRIGFAGAIDHSSTYGLSNKEETIGTVLKKKNYKTAAFGKWHLGCVPEYMPLQNGFDEFFGIPYSHDMWPNHPTTRNYYPPLPLYEGEKVVETMPDHNQFTTRFTERAVDFIKQNKKNPFFLYLPHPLPHVPLGVSDKFKGKSEEGLYGDVMMEIDWSVGQILEAVDNAGLGENTLIIFTSDNGPWINYGNHAGSTGGLREGKGTTYEGGQRVPCLMRWKGTIPEGIVCNKLVAGMDILPTLADIAGAPLPEKRIDGVSVLPLMKGDMQATPRESFYFYYRKNNLEAVTNGEWKLVFAHPGRTYEGFSPGNDGRPGGANENFNHEGGLYDLRRDPGERYNVKFANPEIVKELEKIAEEARMDLGDDLTGNPGANRRKAY